MKKIKKILASIMIGVMAFGAVSCEMIAKTPEAIKNTVLAKVGDEKITKGDVDQELKSYIDQFKETYGEDFESDEQVKTQLDSYRKQVLENLVNEKVLVQKAKQLGIAPEGEELDKEVEAKTEELKNLYGSEESLQQAIDNYGYTDETFKTFMQNQVISQAAVEYMQKDITVTDDEISTYYNENIDSFKKGAGAEVSHILVADEATANEVRQKALNGEDFAKLASEYSTDPGSKDNGGSYGFIEYSSQQYVTEFMDGFKNLKNGEISQPVKTNYGYHIITVKNVQSEEKTRTLEESKSEITTTLEGEKKQTAYDDTLAAWKEELKVKTYEDRI